MNDSQFSRIMAAIAALDARLDRIAPPSDTTGMATVKVAVTSASADVTGLLSLSAAHDTSNDIPAKLDYTLPDMNGGAIEGKQVVAIYELIVADTAEFVKAFFALENRHAFLVGSPNETRALLGEVLEPPKEPEPNLAPTDDAESVLRIITLPKHTKMNEARLAKLNDDLEVILKDIVVVEYADIDAVYKGQSVLALGGSKPNRGWYEVSVGEGGKYPVFTVLKCHTSDHKALLRRVIEIDNPYICVEVNKPFADWILQEMGG